MITFGKDKYLHKSIFTIINLAPVLCIFIILWAIMVMMTWPYQVRGYKFEVHALEKLPYDIAANSFYPDLVIIKITAQRGIFFNDRAINREQLQNEIKKIFDKLPSDRRIIYLKASKDVVYNYVVSVIDEINKGGKKVIKMQIVYLDN